MLYKGEEANDTADILEFFKDHWQKGDAKAVAYATLSHKPFWDTDLTQVPGFADAVTGYLTSILENGVEETIKNL